MSSHALPSSQYYCDRASISVFAVLTVFQFVRLARFITETTGARPREEDLSETKSRA